MSDDAKTESVVGAVRFVALVHEELVAASKALHAAASDEAMTDAERTSRLRDAVQLCFVALYHANLADENGATFCVVSSPTKALRAMLNRRVVPSVEKADAS